MKKKINIVIISIIFSIILWISISLSNYYYATINVDLKIINLPEGFTTGSKLPEKITLKLKGRGWKLTAANIGSETEFQVSAKKDSGWIKLNLKNSFVDNPWLSSEMEVMDISPDTLSFFVEKIVRKKLKIVPDLNLSYKNGFGLASPVYISPESVYVYGPSSLLSKNPVIKTEKKSFYNVDNKVTENIDLQEFQGIKFENNQTRIFLNVQRIVEQNFDNIPVLMRDIPKDRDVILLPNKVSAGVKGGIEYVGKVSTDQFHFYVNYRDVVLDTIGSINIRYELPENVSLIYIKPENLKYIIKKF